MEPADDIPYLNKGQALCELGRYEEALLAYQEAITVDPEDRLAYYGKARVLRELGREEEAQQIEQQAHQIEQQLEHEHAAGE